MNNVVSLFWFKHTKSKEPKPRELTRDEKIAKALEKHGSLQREPKDAG